jgi:hypothetical protein
MKVCVKIFVIAVSKVSLCITHWDQNLNGVHNKSCVGPSAITMRCFEHHTVRSVRDIRYQRVEPPFNGSIQGSEDKAPCILSHSTRLRWMVSFTSWLLNQSRCFYEINLCACWVLNPDHHPVASHCIDWAVLSNLWLHLTNIFWETLWCILTVVIPMCYTELFKIYNLSQTQLFIVVNYACIYLMIHGIAWWWLLGFETCRCMHNWQQ